MEFSYDRQRAPRSAQLGWSHFVCFNRALTLIALFMLFACAGDARGDRRRVGASRHSSGGEPRTLRLVSTVFVFGRD